MSQLGMEMIGNRLFQLDSSNPLDKEFRSSNQLEDSKSLCHTQNKSQYLFGQLRSFESLHHMLA